MTTTKISQSLGDILRAMGFTKRSSSAKILNTMILG